jgi:hypothetical protein
MNELEMATHVNHLFGTFELLKWFRIAVHINYVDTGNMMHAVLRWVFLLKMAFSTCHKPYDLHRNQIIRANEYFCLEIKAEQLVC